MLRRSVGADVRQLVAALAEDDDIRREAAIARLRVIGAPALDRLLQSYEAADRETRIAILRALEATSDRRAIALAGRATAEGGDLATAAVAVLRGALEGPDQAGAADALDALMALAVDTRAARHDRLAAIEALRDVPDVRERLADIVGAEATAAPRAPAADPSTDAVWRDALEGRLPDTPSSLREAAAVHAAATPPGALRRLVEAIRDKET